jgi:hypothetical protein
MSETLNVSQMLSSKFEPKRKFRWILACEGIDAFLLKTAARPQQNFEEVVIDWINGKRYLAGKGEFQTIQIVLYDPIAPSAAQQVMEWIRLNYECVSGRSGYADFYKRDIQIKLLDPLGTVVELWDVKGAWAKESNFGELDYASNDAADITVTIRFDQAVLQF